MDFDRRRCIALPGLVHPRIVDRLRARLELAAFENRHVDDIGDQDVSRDPYAVGLLQLVLGADQIRRVIGRSCGMDIGGFRGTIMRINPNGEQGLGWHDDGDHPGRMLGCTVNLGDAYEGGRLQIASRHDRTLLADVSLRRPGDGVVFAIAPDVVHRVTPVSGTVPRVVGTGWYFTDPALPFTRSRSAPSAHLPADPSAEAPAEPFYA